MFIHNIIFNVIYDPWVDCKCDESKSSLRN